MPAPFVWFDAYGEDHNATTKFMNDMFDWMSVPVNRASMITKSESEQPFAATCPISDDVSGWVPYIEVQDLQGEMDKAAALGATVLRNRTAGPAGDYAIFSLPGGVPLALWKRG